MKAIHTIITLLIAFSFQAQNFSGKAIYKTSTKSNFNIETSNMPEAQRKQLEERLRKMGQKTYTLHFNKIESTYQQDVSLDAPKPQFSGGVRVISIGNSGNADIYYKNVKNKKFSNQTEIMGKRFLVKDVLPKIDWKLSSETKNIGNYTCYKATYTKEVQSVEIVLNNKKKDREKEESKKEIVTITAWYTPQIPISNGPAHYYGLPGLILEVNDGTTTTVCTEIVLNPSKEQAIKEPTKGKKVSQKEFTKISREKVEEMMERFKSRKGVDFGNGVNVKMN